MLYIYINSSDPVSNSMLLELKTSGRKGVRGRDRGRCSLKWWATSEYWRAASFRLVPSLIASHTACDSTLTCIVIRIHLRHTSMTVWFQADQGSLKPSKEISVWHTVPLPALHNVHNMAVNCTMNQLYNEMPSYK